MNDTTPLATLKDAANKTRDALGLKYRPVIIRNRETAFSIAARTRGECVMLGEGAFWLVCLADAERLQKAGFEYAD